jgi:hypothetical protein
LLFHSTVARISTRNRIGPLDRLVRESAKESRMPFKDREKRKAYKRIWAAAKRAKNPEAQREATRKYRAANRELIRERSRELMRARRAASQVARRQSG